MRFECSQAGQIVRGRKHIDKRQRRLHTAREWLISGAAEERIQPHQSSRASLQLRERLRKLFRFAGVPSVAQNDNDRAAVNAPQPLRVERYETRTNPRSSRPAMHVC